MKKQWLSIVLVLCMVLCLTPTTALAADGKTCELKITVEVNGLPTSVSAEGAEFTFQIKKAINTTTAMYSLYDTTTVTVGADGTTGTSTIAVEEGKYIVQQVVHSNSIGEYIWYSISYTGGNNESGPQSVYGNGKSIEFKVYNTYKPASETKVTSLPITVTGYKAGAKVADARVTTTEPGIKLPLFRFMEKDLAGEWTEVPRTEAFKANTEYRVEAYFNKILGCDYTGLKKENVTVNGVEADAFETTWSGYPYNKDYRVIHGLGQPEVVNTVDHIEITKEPNKTTYNAGDKFDPTGMVVIAVYKEDGTTDVLSRDQYVIFSGNNDDKLREGQTYVTIQYDDGSGNSGIKVDQKITVGAYEGPHTHTYAGSPWYSDENSHWHQCTDTDCPDPRASTKDLASHTFVWKVDKAATTTQTGLKHEECTVCGHKRSENTVIPATGGGSSSGGGSAATPPASDKAAKELKNAKEGSTVTIDMKGETKLPASVTKEIAGKDVTVELDMGGGMVWSFNGLDVPKGGVSLDLGVKTGTKAIPAKVINALTGEATTIQLQLDHNGPFGMSLKLSVDLGKKHDGLYANLYFYNPKSGELEFQSAGLISGGKASWAFDHASDYAIVIDKESHEPMTFTDVPDTAYYAEAVNWAVAKKITEGVGNKLFGSNDPCTRAQIVTFLWRAAGSPEPKTMKGFDDVASKAYYAKAVAWAVENGITTGTSASKFSPNDPCTRTQAVTFLFRYAAANGMEAVTMQELLSGYADAASVPSYAVSAMNWALAAGILQGDGVKLMPNATCTRAQIVTFLYRAMK